MPHETPSNAVDLTVATVTVSPTLVATAVPSDNEQVDPTGVDELHFIRIGPETVDLTTLAMSPTITADATATDEVFAIGRRGKYKTENFNSFAAFVTALAADLTPTATVVDLAATGQ